MHLGFAVWRFLSFSFFFFFRRLYPHRFSLHLTLEGSNCLKDLEQEPLSGNPLDTPIRQRGRADAWNFNQKENIEFVEFENVPLKQNAPHSLWYGKLLLLPTSLLHELNYFPCLYSSVAWGTMTLITWVVHLREKPPRLFICPSFFIPCFLLSLYCKTSPQLSSDRVLNGLWGGLEVI